MPVSYIPSAEQVSEKQNSTARKRRRNQNVEIDELGELLPFKPDRGKNLDKLSILRLTTSYIKFQNFMTAAYGDNSEDNQSILTSLLEQAMDGFLLVLADDGMILYASDNLEKFVGLNSRDVIGHSLHDLVQSEEDSETIRENLLPKGNQLNQYRLFYIRLRNTVTPGRVKLSRYNTNMMLQVSGNLKVVLDHSLNISYSKLYPELAADSEVSDDMVPRKPHVLGLIVECRPIESSPSILELNVPQISFTSTVGMDMKIQSVDTKVQEILGFNPEDFIGSTIKDYFHPMDHAKMLPCKQLLQRTGYACSPVFRFMTSTGEWTWVQMEGTLRFNKETREPHHLDVVVKVVSQNEGKFKYIEQLEFYSNGKTIDDCLAVVHRDPYDDILPEKPVSQTHEPFVAGLKEAKVTDSAIDTFLHSRELALCQLPGLITDVVSSEEEAAKLESKNMALFQKVDLQKLKEEGELTPLSVTRLLKEMEKSLDGEQASPPSGNFSSSSSPPQSVSSVPSPLSSVSQPPSVSSTTMPSSVSSSHTHVSSPDSVLATVPSPQSADSALSLVPSPNSAVPSVYSPNSVLMDPDSGIDSPTSAGSNSSPSETGTSTLHSFVPNGPMPVQVPYQQSGNMQGTQFQNAYLDTAHVSRPPVSQSSVPHSTSYSFHPQSTTIPNTFNFTTQQQQQQQLFTQQTNGPVSAPTNDETLEMLLSALTSPQQLVPQHQPLQSAMPQQLSAPEGWMEKQQKLEEQIQHQQKLLQELLLQQQYHQMELQQPTTHGQLPVQDGGHLSLTPTPSPASSATPSPYPSKSMYSESFGSSPHPPQPTNENRNGLAHTTDNTTNLSFLGSVDYLPQGVAPPSAQDLQELWQQLQQ